MDHKLASHIVMRPVAALVPYAQNARTHSAEQVEQLARSIREFGFTNPVLVDASDTIIAGHGRVLAAGQCGLEQVPTIRVDWLTDAQRRAYILADNQLALNAGWDDAILSGELDALRTIGFDLTLVGFTDEKLDAMVAAVDAPPADPDAAPGAPKVSRSMLGDVWLLGGHRVICGDSTSRDVLEHLMGAERADAAWTDPPYNVVYVGATKDALTIENDDMSGVEFAAFLRAAFNATAHVMKPGAAIYVAYSDAESISFRTAFHAAGFKSSSCLIWRKSQLVLGRSDYQSMHEPILYGWKEGHRHRWFGGRKKTTVQALHDAGGGLQQLEDGRFQIVAGDRVLILDADAKVEELVPTVLFHDKPKRSEQHPTMKPVGLIESMLRNSARPGDVVLDPFGGSGSTLIAAERLGMHARLCELDPKYVDVIVTRWQQYTGRSAVHARSGAAFQGVPA